MDEDSRTIRGRDAQRMIVDTAWNMAEAVRATLGPRGMDMMLVDRMGNQVLTNDGATILKALETRDPIAKIISEVAKSQEQNAYDGTTTCIILIGELLRRADELINRGVHPNAIIKGYRIALEQALAAAREYAIPMEPIDAAYKVAHTAMTGKSAEDFVENLAEICAKAASIAEPSEIKLLTFSGKPQDAELIEGVVVLKSAAAPGMPKELKGKIMLLEPELGPPIANVSLADPSKIAEIAQIQNDFLQNRMDTISELGVKIVFCQKGMDSRVTQYMRKAGMLAFKNIRRSDMQRIAAATGAEVITDISDFNEEDLGEGEVTTHKAANAYACITGKKSEAATILMPAPTEQAAEEFQRALEDAVGVSYLCVKEPFVVNGAGSIQARMSSSIKTDHNPVENPKVEAARLAYADALMIIPQTLAESAGMDVMDITVKMTANPTLGVDVNNMILQPMEVYEPLAVVNSAMSSAVENGVSLLRTHSIVMAKPIQEIFGERAND